MRQLCINYTEQPYAYFYPNIEDPADGRSQKTLKQWKKNAQYKLFGCIYHNYLSIYA